MSTLVSFSEYAAHIGSSAPYVSKLRKQGRLVIVIDANGKERVDQELTDRLLKNTADPSRAGNGANAKPSAGTTISSNIIESGKVNEVFMRAKSAEAVHRAKLLEMKYKTLSGKLLDTDEVHQTQFELARQVRDAMMSIPPRLQDVLAAESDPSVVGALLTAEIRLALETEAKQTGGDIEEIDIDIESASDMETDE
jgi:phage terminase Nu1 subunit (DNA packaging protein)